MYKLLIKVSGQQKQLFCFSNSIIIGRDEKCDLVLPDPSISRQHARIHVKDEALFTEDLGSQNGIVVDGTKGKQGQQQRIKSKSEIQLGKFSLVLLTEALSDQFYRGKSIVYLPEYDATTLMTATDPETIKLSNRAANSALREQNLINKACIVETSGKKTFPDVPLPPPAHHCLPHVANDTSARMPRCAATLHESTATAVAPSSTKL